ncbi:MAG: hypothetical protein WDM81_13425 [Rhizomicrobium sp.]
MVCVNSASEIRVAWYQCDFSPPDRDSHLPGANASAAARSVFWTSPSTQSMWMWSWSCDRANGELTASATSSRGIRPCMSGGRIGPARGIQPAARAPRAAPIFAGARVEQRGAFDARDRIGGNEQILKGARAVLDDGVAVLAGLLVRMRRAFLLRQGKKDAGFGRVRRTGAPARQRQRNSGVSSVFMVRISPPSCDP